MLKIIVESSLLAETLADAQKALPTKTPLEILTGVLIETSTDGLNVTGTSERVTIQANIPEEHINVIRGGSVVLPKVALELIGKLSGEIEIDVSKGQLITISNDNEEVQVIGFDPEEFPKLPEVNWEETTVFRGKDLKELIKKTVFAVATSNTMPEITGVNIVFQEERVDFIATDRNRTASIQRNMSPKQYGSAIVEGRGLVELEKIIFDKDEVQFGFSKLKSGDVFLAFVKTDRFTFFSRVLEGEFPDVQNKINRVPKESSVEVDKKELAKALDLIYTLAKEEKTNLVKLEASASGLVIRGSGKGMGKAKREVCVKSLSGNQFSIALNAKYVIDLLKAVESETIIISYTGKTGPVIFKGDESEGSNFVVLPYRTAG